MKPNKTNLYSRRQILAGGSALALTGAMPGLSLAATTPEYDFLLKAGTSSTQILPSNWAETPLWTYSGECPGPVIRAKQGEHVRILVENGLEESTTVHWHGLRVPNTMDGVPHVSQEPIEPGQNFLYDFKLEDAGTYWYHPHVNSSEQLGRGLYGTIIVEETDPPEVDRDVVWVLDDWRVSKDGSIRDDFTHGMDISHGGRMGNYITVNGHLPEPLKVTANERIRLRLINVANARIFGLNFENHNAQVIAIDGHPVTPHAPSNDMVLLGPGQRADVIIDCVGEPGSKHRILDMAYEQSINELQDIEYLDASPVRKKPLGPVKALPANPLKEPDLTQAVHHEMVISGGAMSGMRGAVYKGKKRSMRELMGEMKVWALNGVAAHTTDMPPIFNFDLGKTYVIDIKNESMFPHPMHLHGHAFRLLSMNGKDVPHTPWMDTVLLTGRETARIAMVADNPGDWLFHCHVLAHVQGGMTSLIRVA